MKYVFVILTITISACSYVRWPDSTSVSIEDMEGVGNPEIEECQITFGGEVPAVPCEIQLQLEWEI